MLLGKPKGSLDRIAMAVSGDNKQSKDTVSTLINDIGFDAIDAGKLEDSWRHQPGTPAYCTELNTRELGQTLDNTNKEKAAILRDDAIVKLSALTTPPTHQDIVEFNRSLFSTNPKF